MLGNGAFVKLSAGAVDEAFKNGALVTFANEVLVVFRYGAEVALTNAVDIVAFKRAVLVVFAMFTWVVGAVPLRATTVVVLRNLPVDVAFSAEAVVVKLDWPLPVCPSTAELVVFRKGAVPFDGVMLLVKPVDTADVEFAKVPTLEPVAVASLVGKSLLDMSLELAVVLLPTVAVELILPRPDDALKVPIVLVNTLEEFVNKAVEFVKAGRVA
jgi:hypothetical protein